MQFQDLEKGKRFIDCRGIPNNTTSLRLFQKVDPKRWGIEVDSNVDGLAINMKNSQPTIFGLKDEVLEIEM